MTSAWSSDTWNTLQSCNSVCRKIDDLLLQSWCCTLGILSIFLHWSEFDLQLKGAVHPIQNWPSWIQMSWMPVDLIPDYLLRALQCRIIYFRPVSYRSGLYIIHKDLWGGSKWTAKGPKQTSENLETFPKGMCLYRSLKSHETLAFLMFCLYISNIELADSFVIFHCCHY